MKTGSLDAQGRRPCTPLCTPLERNARDKALGKLQSSEGRPFQAKEPSMEKSCYNYYNCSSWKCILLFFLILHVFNCLNLRRSILVGEIPESNVDLYGSIDHEHSPEGPMELYQILSDGEIQVLIIVSSFRSSFKCFSELVGEAT